MAVCYLFANYEVQYKCEYILKKEFIEVDIDYDIEKEIERGYYTVFKRRK